MIKKSKKHYPSFSFTVIGQAASVQLKYYFEIFQNGIENNLKISNVIQYYNTDNLTFKISKLYPII